MSNLAPTSIDSKVAEFNRKAAETLHKAGAEAILTQMRLHAEIVAGMQAENARLRDIPALINEALNRPDVVAAFRDPKRVVVSVRKEDDPKSHAIGDYVAYQSDLESVVSDRQFPSLLAWFVTVAMGQEVVMEVEEP